MCELSIHLSLSVKGLQWLEAVDYGKDFCLAVGNECYYCPALVSPRITSLRSHYITIQECAIDTENPNHYFGTLLSVGFGRDISFAREALPFGRAVWRMAAL
jgi:hypothetical protein